MTQRNEVADLVTKAEAAQLLRVSIRTIDRYMGIHLSPRFTPTGRVRFDRADVLSLLTPVETSPVASTGVSFIP